MNYNLLSEQWLPVQTKTGAARLMRPAEALDATTPDPAVALAHPRPDLGAGLHEFLFALVQTAMAPKNEDAWLDLHPLSGAPPNAIRIDAACSKLANAFDLFSKDVPYMQERNLPDSRILPIDNLLIDTPTSATIGDGKDVFQHRRSDPRLCLSCAAAAVHTLQSFAPSGGRGHRTSPRGGGPLTIALPDDTLWATVWNGILSRGELAALNALEVDAQGASMPWTASADERERWSSKGLLLTEAAPEAVLWPTSRRILLDAPQAETPAPCVGCGREVERSISGYQDQAYGVDYKGAWMHPLTPFSVIDGQHNTVKASMRFTSFGHFAALVYGSNRWERAASLKRYGQRVQEGFERSAFQVRFSGYDMDSAKVNGWLDIELPAHAMAEARIVAHRTHLQFMVEGMQACASELEKRIKGAWFSGGTHAAATGAGKRLRERAARLFFKLEADAVNDPTGAPDQMTRLREQWRTWCATNALKIFEEFAITGSVADGEPSRIAKEHERLRRRVWGKPMRKLLGLAEETQASQDKEDQVVKVNT